jgi:hypothetical protein
MVDNYEELRTAFNYQFSVDSDDGYGVDGIDANNGAAIHLAADFYRFRADDFGDAAGNRLTFHENRQSAPFVLAELNQLPEHFKSVFHAYLLW